MQVQLEKQQTAKEWRQAHGPDVESRFSKDQVLTNFSLT
jgi:hypothetical protein